MILKLSSNNEKIIIKRQNWENNTQKTISKEKYQENNIQNIIPRK